MPHALNTSHQQKEMEKYGEILAQLIRKGRDIKSSGDIEPSITRAYIQDELRNFDGLTASAAVEAALRQHFYNILASRSMSDPEFVDMWSLLDVCLILSDDGICEVGLTFWLVEELLESQVIEHCRRVFDYLELRREPMVAKHMGTKKLIILRACNELLKRLSRAEDTVFCGRVFIYLFESLAFGDRSAVNLRGEFHVDNVTSYEADDVPGNESTTMEVDPDASTIDGQQSDGITKTSQKDGRKATHLIPTATTASQLYPLFWSLQRYFCKPTVLFDQNNLLSFKHGLEATLAKFKDIHKDNDIHGGVAVTEENRPNLKRKWEEASDSNNTFNPKYLTSRDLFELEINDLAFRRHIMVQGLILMDFLLCQTPNAKRKLETLKNKSVIYSFTLSDEDAQWAERMRVEIATYLQQGAEGKFYYRMVDTVLSRDKNWVFWKAESCPSFARGSISAEQFLAAQAGAQKSSTSKRLRPSPLGAIDLDFLDEFASSDGLSRLASAERYGIPAADSFRPSIMDDEMDIDMARTEEEKNAAIEAKSSKIWRTLRIASRNKFRDFDKVDDGKDLDVLFKDPTTEQEDVGHNEAVDPLEDKSGGKEQLSASSHTDVAGEDSREGEAAEHNQQNSQLAVE